MGSGLFWGGFGWVEDAFQKLEIKSIFGYWARSI